MLMFGDHGKEQWLKNTPLTYFSVCIYCEFAHIFGFIQASKESGSRESRSKRRNRTKKRRQHKKQANDAAFCRNCTHVLCGPCFIEHAFPIQCINCITSKYFIDYSPYNPPYDPVNDDEDTVTDTETDDKENNTEIGKEPALKKRKYQ